MPFLGAPLFAHSRPCHKFSPNFKAESALLVQCRPIAPAFRHNTHRRIGYTLRSSNLRDEATSEPASLPDQFTDDDPGPSKFQPFVARNELRRRMLGYYRELPAANDQVLIVQPVSEEWIEPAADLLTEAFADSMGYISVYKNFLRRQIRNYLRSHMNLPPKTVCLIALLVAKDVLESQPKIDEDSGFYSDLDIASDDDGGGGNGSNGITMGDGMGNNIWPDFSTRSSTSDHGSGSEIDGVATRSRRSLRLDASIAKLVGAVEVSFTESTRSKEWTGLNPPPERPYLCNMAIKADTRRQGIGGLLLTAAEDLVQRVGEDQLYLHLRFKDAPAAALYRKAGYTPAAQDSILVRLVGQDRRWLMKKNLKEE